jgi:hypothetical protein
MWAFWKSASIDQIFDLGRSTFVEIWELALREKPQGSEKS